MATQSSVFRRPGRFRMHRGGSIAEAEFAYETWGELSAARDNAILLFTGLSPSAHAASSPQNPASGWWEGMIGPGLALDTRRYFVICVNSLGSCFGSSGPASVNPDTGKRYRLAFPTLTLEDVGEGGFEVMRHLGIERLHTVVGCSMGGMSALGFAARHPGAAQGMISVSSAARALPFAIAVRSLQREMIQKDPKWLGGDYALDDPPLVGQRLARKLGMLTYRSAEEFAERFGRERIAGEGDPATPFYGDFAVESYLEAQALKFTGQFDPNCYLYLSRASDLFDLAEHGGSLAAGFGRLELERALVVGVTTDILFPLQQQRELAEGLQRAGTAVDFEALPCIKGHDSFLAEIDAFRPVLSRYFAG